MLQSTLFTCLPEDYACTPDGMAIDSQGRLILACPNFADTTKPGCILRFDESGKAEKWIELPVLAETGLVCPMGIAFGPEGDLYVIDNQSWLGSPEVKDKGRILRLHLEGDRVVGYTTIASGMEHPNGMRIRNNQVYITQSMLSRAADPSGKLVSCVYRFDIDDKDIVVTNTLDDSQIITTFVTLNPECQYGADGIEFDTNGDLLVGNFGDGAVHRVTFNEAGDVTGNTVWAKNPAELQSTDGMILDANGDLYIADFCANAIARVSPDGTVKRIAQSPDSDGLHGELDQPGEPIVWKNKIIVSCFDLVTGPDKVNTGHEMPATLAAIDLQTDAGQD